MKYLVTVREIYEHTYLTEVNSKEEAEIIVAQNSEGCDLRDYEDVEYEARELENEDPDDYDECYEDGDEDLGDHDEGYDE